jgi:hypothetical protein
MITEAAARHVFNVVKGVSMSTRRAVVVEPDTASDRPNEIEFYMHCAKCLQAIPPDTTPRAWGALEVGFQTDGTVQVWCKRCEQNVAVVRVTIKGGDV